MRLTVSLAKWILKTSQRVPLFRARGSYSLRRLGAVDQPASFPEARVEYADHEGFLENFRNSGVDVLKVIGGKQVLDFGSGYGGRTVWLARHATHVSGVEIYSNLVDKSVDFARAQEASNVTFTLGAGTVLPFPDDCFDCVISYDVLEHVEQPDVTLRELGRVLKPGGLALLVFTPYYGMFCHHLNYISLFPSLHWVFSASTLVKAVNELLEQDERFKNLVALQPLPRPSFNGKRLTLPSLNGLTKREYLGLISRLGFRQIYARTTPILERFRFGGPFGAWANRVLCGVPWIDELFGHNLVSVLEKPLQQSAE